VNVGSLLVRHAQYSPDKLAVACGQYRLSFGELRERVDRLSNALTGLGLRKGDRVALVLPNCIELLDAYRACAQMGFVSVPLSPMLRGAGLVGLLRDAGTAAVIVCDAVVEHLGEARQSLAGLANGRWINVGKVHDGFLSYHDLVQSAAASTPDLPEISGDDVYNIIYSSGTTGEPKGIVHTHEVRARYGALFASQFRFTPESVVMHAGSLVFNGAFVTLMPAWFLGCRYILQEKFDAVEFIETVERERVTHVIMVPSQIVALLDAPNFSARKLVSLQMLCSVGAPWHREHKERMLAVLPNSLYELYGLTEGFITVLDRSDFVRNIDSVGIPIVFSELRIADDKGEALPVGEIGEIVGRSPLMMPGYHGRPDLTAAALRDGWLYTGDVGRVDERGFLHLVDRKKDMIISGGVNVFPKDIEEVAVQHPAVREVAVFGVPSEKWGEAPVAAIVLRDDEAIPAETLRSWINERVSARYQHLHAVHIVPDFPRSSAGKTLKRVLRDRYSSLPTVAVHS
jgi:long-chain acyl-CoA synthetase